MSKCFPKNVAPVIDIFPDLCGVPYRYGSIRNKMELLAQLGYSRVYLVISLPGYPMYSNPWLSVMNPDNQAGNYSIESILSVGDPVFEHIFEAHRVGMEAFAVMKPYEGGGGYTIPHGKQASFKNRSLSCIGGERVGLDSFLPDHGNMRVMRKPIPNYEQLIAQPITRLTLSFCLDQVEERISYDRTDVFASKPDTSLINHPMTGIQLWTSVDNGTYELYEGSLEIREEVVVKPLFDANGLPLFDEPKRCREVHVTNLNIPPDAGYLAITMEMEQEQVVMIPYSMICVYGDLGEIPVTCTPYVRNEAVTNNADSDADDPLQPFAPGTEKWFDATYPIKVGAGFGINSGAKSLFKRNGFEFEWYGAGIWGNGWMGGTCYGIARGKMTYMKGTHCEAYPEVREYWLDVVKKLIAVGIDGVDFRLQNHSGMVSDYVNYGYNEPIVEAYQKEYGIDILTEQADPLNVMRIRGEFYLQFVTDAAHVLHEYHKIVQIHFHDCYENPQISSSFGELGFWAMPKVLPDWEKMIELADEITIKDYNWGTYRNALSTQIKDRAAALHKPLWVHCYIAQGDDLRAEFVEGVVKDHRVTGVLLYEIGHNPYAYNPWVGLIEVRSDGVAVFNKEVLERVVTLFGKSS
ncbi:hypothetical protein GC096_12475 [Paenibacillus sp. LMG 31461]|uniref:Uncharacterized protein n=1 Tax=Paenibacillus plantarum TaxID=2654975 RepID=A0ABX1X8Y0_9BACL|nr:hypothetical protein [Paenibacillus plantarum]NOU64844.1 hypothetical protein [Paenibacillus plantarum]